jgi:hypothetical protein
MKRIVIILSPLLVIASPTPAAVSDSAAGGFSVVIERKIGPDSIERRQMLWALMITPSRWWSPAHTWSGDASALSLDPLAGGCWCEKLKDGGMAEHGRVILVEPQRRLLLRGELGPLLNLPATGKFELSIGATAGQTTATLRYAVGGYGLGDTAQFAKAVDGVLGEQTDRLAKAAATAP